MRRSFRSIAVLLTVLLLANIPVKAGPVTIGDVVQIVGSYQNPPSLGLLGLSQGRSSSTSGTQTIDRSVVITNYDSLLSGVVVTTETTQDPVNIVVQGDVEGTVCDCGEVTVPGGFPKWPLVFLAAIPFFFIEDDDCDDCDKIIPTPTPTPNPTPTPPPTPTPEPASLLLFGSGLAALGAGLRRRRLKAKLKIEGESTEEG